MQETRTDFSGATGRNSNPFAVQLVTVVIATLWLSGSACHRAHYRRQADAEATEIIRREAERSPLDVAADDD